MASAADAAKAQHAYRAPELLITWLDLGKFGGRLESREISVRSFHHLFIEVPVDMRNEDRTPLPKDKAKHLFAQILPKVPHNPEKKPIENIFSDTECYLTFEVSPDVEIGPIVERIKRIAKKNGIRSVIVSPDLLGQLEVKEWKDNATWRNVVSQIPRRP